MMRYILVISALSVFLLLFSSCIVAVVDYPEAPIEWPSERYRRIVPLEAGGTIALENMDGDIEIRGWDKDRVEISAVKVFPRSYGWKVRMFYLKNLRPRIEIDRFEDFIKIKTKPAAGERRMSLVHYDLRVPHSINLKDIVGNEGDVLISDLYGEAYIEMERGDISVENFSGSLTASVVDGSVRAELYDLRFEDEVRVTTNEGDITVFLQPDVAARIEARALNGEILSEFDLKVSLPAQEVSAQIGEKRGALLSLSASNGDIHIREIEQNKDNG